MGGGEEQESVLNTSCSFCACFPSLHQGCQPLRIFSVANIAYYCEYYPISIDSCPLRQHFLLFDFILLVEIVRVRSVTLYEGPSA